MDELKPCPFCGHTAHIARLKWSANPRYFVVCGNGKEHCIASEHSTFGGFYVNKKDAIEAWNRRADNGT